jgi:MFS family permease
LIAKSRRKVIIGGNLIVILGSSLCVIKDIWSISVGRVLIGFGAGLGISAAPKIIEESIPEHILQYGFGISTNLAVCIAISL